tara:strand:+ start:606 stop:944 length:339 start_codon:yes stop_codon:yes gene_type:complete
MTKNTTTILLGAAALGAAYFIYKGMQTANTSNGGGSGSGGSGSGGSGSGQTTAGKVLDVAKGLFKNPDDALLKQACDLSYSAIGANRYLCYKKVKAPKDEFLHILEPAENGQ